jgi:hypothetical protein
MPHGYTLDPWHNIPAEDTALGEYRLNLEQQRTKNAFDALQAEQDAVKSSLEFKITDYVGVNRTGGADVSAIWNQAATDASNIAIANGHRRVDLINPRGDYRVDTPIYFKDRVRFIIEGCRVIAGADWLGNGMFRTNTPGTAPFPAVAQGTAETTLGDYVLRNVSDPFAWDDSMVISGTGIPATTHVELVDDYDKTIVMDKPATATGTTTITRAATWHGQYNHCGIVGGILDPNQKHTQATIYAAWTHNFTCEYTEVLHNRPTDGTDANWAFAILQARDAFLDHPKVTSGRAVWEDGLHITGKRINIVAPQIECGDDCIAIGDEDPGGESAGFPAGIAILQQGSRWITVSDPVCNSMRGFAVKLYAFGDAGPVQDITVTGITGRAGVYRNGGLYFTDNQGSNPGSNRIARIHIEGRLEVGSMAHWGTAGGTLDFNDVPLASPVGPAAVVYADSADDVYIDLALTVQEPIVPIFSARTIWYFVGCNNVTLGPRCGDLNVVRGNYRLFNINNCPNFNVLADSRTGSMSRRTYHVEWKEDFLGRSLDTSKWTAHLGTDAECAASVATSGNSGRGRCILATGNDVAGTMATNGAQITGGLNWHRENGVQAQGLSMEAVSALTGASLTHCVFIGYTDQNTILEMPFTLVGDTLTANVTDGIGFLYDSAATGTNGGNWRGVVAVAGVTQIIDLGVNGGEARPAFAYGSTNLDRHSLYAQTDGRITWYMNGIKRGVTSGGVPSVLLAPIAAVFSRSGTLRWLELDLIHCEMRRAN